jgi:hypothetical protein
MRLLLCFVGAAGFVATGWICWRATAQTRDWREFVALGTKTRRNQAEWDRFVHLGQRLFPDHGALGPREVTVLDGPEGQRRVLVLFALLRREARLHVLEEDGRRLSSCEVPVGPCGVDCRPTPDRGPWAFDIELLTPGAPWRSRYVLVDDRPVLVSPAVKE